ncbi:hypothetical protein KSC_085520 [Ktedonobacter sp. SOSP1-52]|nr:hypothetical protein KSC_085520 [Ktedonobacter sp. SOSP1-52]
MYAPTLADISLFVEQDAIFAFTGNNCVGAQAFPHLPISTEKLLLNHYLYAKAHLWYNHQYMQ